MDREEWRQDQLTRINKSLDGVASRLEEMARLPLSCDTLTVRERIGLARSYAKILSMDLGKLDAGFRARMLADCEKTMAMPCRGLETASLSQKEKLAKAEMRLAEVKQGKSVRIQ